MNQYLSSLLDKFCGDVDEVTLFRNISDKAKELGFDYCCYGIRFPIPISQPKTLILDTYPAGWMANYKEKGYVNIDPTVQAGLQSTDVIVWSDSLFSKAQGLWDEAREFGIAGGVAHSSLAPFNVIGLLTLARPTSCVTEAEAFALRGSLSILSWTAHTLMSELLAPKYIPEANEKLTFREREVLRWTAEGKTAHEIGLILKIADRTVNFHINNSLQKLHSTNKTQAVVKAALIGLIN
ncbi:LuxR family quorum-sensing system transcriptional regulator SolR [Paraburkholderia sp. BL6665CI2N2]|uniref:autoinducer binding domain-containing protein n=1 Tax=Paraburkholderia sp. BL6665CI2N2 TaxID=1938806 RepID=UPI0010646513|nr:autoinducer binding domain-containing protein [Paraburkholderia sp. BL6665CI2N2]TDY16707.1 LuxR family quorum-sensing system transcriptional regulator SolR [Paraburkholderia sp. BL6665CI2N2]